MQESRVRSGVGAKTAGCFSQPAAAGDDIGLLGPKSSDMAQSPVMHSNQATLLGTAHAPTCACCSQGPSAAAEEGPRKGPKAAAEAAAAAAIQPPPPPRQRAPRMGEFPALDEAMHGDVDASADADAEPDYLAEALNQLKIGGFKSTKDGFLQHFMEVVCVLVGLLGKRWFDYSILCELYVFLQMASPQHDEGIGPWQAQPQ